MFESEQIIWQRFVGGNPSSFKQLMQASYHRLFDYGTKFSRDPELVKDCIQDLFLNLWDKRETISKTVNVKAYLFSSLRRALHRKLKSPGRTATHEAFEENTGYFTFQVSIEEQIIANESAKQLAKRIAALLENLPDRQKEVIYLKFFHNLGRDEMATAMNISPQTVSNLLQIALKKLKDDSKHDFDPTVLLFILPIIFK